jgi:formylmethanofuran dehydrogenase subunit E
MGGKKINPEQAKALMIEKGVEPLVPFMSDKTNWQSRCLTCHRIVSPRFANVKNGHAPCVYCSGRKIPAEEAVKVMREADLEPLEPYKNFRTKWRSKCLVCGTECYPILKTILGGQGGCLNCVGHLVTPEAASAAMAKMDWEPLEAYPGSASPWKCRCNVCGEISYPTHHKVSREKTRRCPTCTPNGFNFSEDGYLYLLRHNIWGLFKVGISNSPMDRTENHETRGWETLEIRGPMDGALAAGWESSILKMLQGRRAELGREDIAGKFDGYTESWVADSFQVSSIQQLMDLVHEDEDNSPS